MRDLLPEKITFFLGNAKTVKNLSYSGYFQTSVQALVHAFLICMTAPLILNSCIKIFPLFLSILIFSKRLFIPNFLTSSFVSLAYFIKSWCLGVFVLSQLEVAYVASASITDFAGKPCRPFPPYH